MNASPDLPFDPDLFDLLVCPESRSPLAWVEGRLVSTDPATRRVYRVEAGIPVMLIEESEVLSEADWQRCMASGARIAGGVAAVRARHAAGPS